MKHGDYEQIEQHRILLGNNKMKESKYNQEKRGKMHIVGKKEERRNCNQLCIW